MVILSLLWRYEEGGGRSGRRERRREDGGWRTEGE
jgi:hypothetical protein